MTGRLTAAIEKLAENLRVAEDGHRDELPVCHVTVLPDGPRIAQIGQLLVSDLREIVAAWREAEHSKPSGMSYCEVA